MRHNNNFDLLRLIAALMVLWTHAFMALNLVEPTQMGWINLGTLGVTIFFAISGYLITASFLSNDLITYARNRILRIFPGLWAQYFLVILVLGLIASNLPLNEYFIRVSNIKNIGLLPFKFSFPALPGTVVYGP